MKDEQEYLNLVYEYVVKKDPDVMQFIPQLVRVRLSFEFLTIAEKIVTEARSLLGLDSDVPIPGKRFKRRQNVNFDQPIAQLTENLFSTSNSKKKGVLKHVEMRVGLGVKKPTPRAVTKYIEENYSKEEIASLPDLDQISRFAMKEIVKLNKGRITKISSYDPFSIFSNDITEVRKAVEEVFFGNFNNSRLFIEAVEAEVTSRDAEILTDILLSSKILDALLKYQKLSTTDISDLSDIYKELTSDKTVDPY